MTVSQGNCMHWEVHYNVEYLRESYAMGILLGMSVSLPHATAHVCRRRNSDQSAGRVAPWRCARSTAWQTYPNYYVRVSKERRSGAGVLGYTRFSIYIFSRSLCTWFSLVAHSPCLSDTQTYTLSFRLMFPSLSGTAPSRLCGALSLRYDRNNQVFCSPPAITSSSSSSSSSLFVSSALHGTSVVLLQGVVVFRAPCMVWNQQCTVALRLADHLTPST